MSIYGHSQMFCVFRNREVDSLYVMNALSVFATSLISIFIPVYFFELGIPIWAIILFYFLRAAYYVVFSYFSLPVMRYLSDKMMIFLGIPFLIGAFLMVNQIGGIGSFFFAAPALFALHSVFFNTGYHSNFSTVADKGDRGKEVGMNIVIMDIARFVSPFLGALLIINSGFHVTLLLVSSILVLSVIPLFFFSKRDFCPRISAERINKALRDKGLKNFRKATFGYVVERMNASILWPLFIFLFVGSIKVLGEYVSFGLLAGAIASYIAGKLSDKGKSTGLFAFSGIGQFLIWIFRSFVNTTGALLGVHIGGYVFRDATVSSWSSRYYNLIQDKEDPGIHIVAQETYYNIVRMVVYPFLILIAFLLPMKIFFPASFILAGIFSLFYMFAGR